MTEPNWSNRTLWTGDNLDIMRGMNSVTVDLVYLDPPFNSNRDYAAPIGSEAAGAAFKDTWSLSDVDEAWHGEIADRDPTLYAIVDAAGLSHSKAMKSYLIMMAVRLLEMRRLLKDTSSIYLHCDPIASHYLKQVVDAIFGHENFRNEIIWCYRGLPSKAKKFQAKHDVILFYSGGGKPVFNTLTGPPTEGSLKTFESGRKRGYNVNNSKKMATVFDWDKYYEAVDHGVIPPDLKPVEFSGGNPPLRDWWDDIKILGGPRNKERMGYPTQKPLALLERIIEASSEPGDVVLDPFCGCATALVAADRLDRQWVGIDLSPLAAKLVNSRLRDDMGLFFDIHHRTDIPHRTDPGVTCPATGRTGTRSTGARRECVPGARSCSRSAT